ncbi:acyl-CoA thioesterase/bile acid-CoA:amino acid N-acyltransferase family protein [Streptomyces daliensis]|uniref:Acyl-CoA thioesterase/BAAT N-terminal domain-containing protein n=1 Tax=Streptomyces daliensis TaxID=299421 RepID=A0A8T4IXE0_9ACTN|nr:acyl-CoA thioesterase/BAAT N-terminal domain-containing protein [Streptomyces daliensis]
MGRKRNVRAAVAAPVALAVLAGAAACSGGDGASAPQKKTSRDGVQVKVSDPVTTADKAVEIKVTGLEPGQRVTVAADAKDQRDASWAARGAYTADGDGVLDLGERAPQGGEPYEGADSMGLLSSMLPRNGTVKKMIGSGKAFSYHPATPDKQSGYQVRLTVAERGKSGGEGKKLATRVLSRQWLHGDVQHRKLTVDEDGVDGELYSPARGKGEKRKAPVLVFGGSEGGNAGEYAAALLAAHGHPTLSLCYFRCGEGSGRPDALNKIDLDYFTRAMKTLNKQPSADPGKLAVMGNSRGSEVAQLLGQRRPELVRDVIAYAPSSKVNGPYLAGADAYAAWLDDGEKIPAGPIPLDRVRGTVLAVAGDNDKMWGSAASARDIASQHNASGEPHQQVTYKGAGHHVNWFPYGQPGQEGGQDGQVTSTAKADQHARESSWPRILKLLGG